MHQLITVVLTADTADEANDRLTDLTLDANSPLFGVGQTYDYGTPLAEESARFRDFAPELADGALPLSDEAARERLRERFESQAEAFAARLDEVREELAGATDEDVMDDLMLRHRLWSLSPYASSYHGVYNEFGDPIISREAFDELLEESDDRLFVAGIDAHY